jgi:hypothetical protein
MRKADILIFLQRILIGTALSLGLVASGAISAHAGSVMVIGGKGANGGPHGAPGGVATATTTTPSEPTNTATAIGGQGGEGVGEISCGPFCGGCCLVDVISVFPDVRVLPGVGGAGGAATATATTSIATGSASATANSTGGVGGPAEGVDPHGGAGGAAASTATSSSGTGPASATATSTGGAGGSPGGGGGGAQSTATASTASSGTGPASATATSTGGAGGSGAQSTATASTASSSGTSAIASATGGRGAAVTGAVSASASAGNRNGRASATASAPGATSASALTQAVVGSGIPALPEPVQGAAVSDASLNLSGSKLASGVMSADDGGYVKTLQYVATATFAFSTSAAENLSLDLLSDRFSSIGFDTLQLQVVVDGKTHTYSFTSLTGSAGAETFFSAHDLGLGSISEGSQDISLTYKLGYTSAASGAGFGFAYELTASPIPAVAALDSRMHGLDPAVPELPTWAMMAAAFALLGAGHCARRLCGASLGAKA